jgi:hypothetical protein
MKILIMRSERQQNTFRSSNPSAFDNLAVITSVAGLLGLKVHRYGFWGERAGFRLYDRTNRIGDTHREKTDYEADQRNEDLG